MSEKKQTPILSLFATKTKHHHQDPHEDTISEKKQKIDSEYLISTHKRIYKLLNNATDHEIRLFLNDYTHAEAKQLFQQILQVQYHIDEFPEVNCWINLQVFNSMSNYLKGRFPNWVHRERNKYFLLGDKIIDGASYYKDLDKLYLNDHLLKIIPTWLEESLRKEIISTTTISNGVLMLSVNNSNEDNPFDICSALKIRKLIQSCEPSLSNGVDIQFVSNEDLTSWIHPLHDEDHHHYVQIYRDLPKIEQSGNTHVDMWRIHCFFTMLFPTINIHEFLQENPFDPEQEFTHNYLTNLFDQQKISVISQPVNFVELLLSSGYFDPTRISSCQLYWLTQQHPNLLLWPLHGNEENHYRVVISQVKGLSSVARDILHGLKWFQKWFNNLKPYICIPSENEPSVISKNSSQIISNNLTNHIVSLPKKVVFTGFNCSIELEQYLKFNNCILEKTVEYKTNVVVCKMLGENTLEEKSAKQMKVKLMSKQQFWITYQLTNFS